MELVKPENEIGYQEVSNFIPAVVENQRPPLLVLANAWVGMFVQMAAIEEGKPVTVFGEVTGHPIDDHPDSFGMAAINEGAEFVWGAVATCWGIPTGDLVAP